MKISKINYEIINEENDYLAESRAQKMREMANELRAQRDKAREVNEPATQEIGWKKVQVFIENIETQIRLLLYIEHYRIITKHLTWFYNTRNAKI